MGVPIDWATTLAKHDRWLRITVGARLGERQAVDEVMQEVALAAVEQRAPLTDVAKVAAWLHRLAVRKALLYRRHRGRQSKLVDRFTLRITNRTGTSPTRDPLDWLLHDERLRHVRDALGRLSPRDAEILMLKYSEDWSYRQLAEHLGTNVSTVEARLHRARGRLRTALAAIEDREVLT
ncbi:RNA polymerase sigma factor [Singulisphaera sp. PoT]|uniref:RNA polymerase sigma factor n=1 Tax=Singulisphaera sp. PoT TaxID=3411797 RepID=UPI003BF5EB10